MTRPTYIDPDLVDAERIVLGSSEGRHAATVRRTKVGEQIDVVDGRGLRVTIEVESVTKSEVVGRRLGCVREDARDPHLTLVQALAKGGRDEQAIETCTEFGVDAFIPWMSERTIVRWNDRAKADKGRAKLADTAWAAAKQSRRAYVPQVRPAVTSKELASIIADFDGTVLVCHEEATTPLPHLMPLAGHVMLIVGPEGGISPQEIEAFEGAGARTILLGQHVLRSASAGAWATAVIRAYSR
ncbi:16S rRNA (uracil(1498)-N(3))-methyltransferase [Trueperella pecoris]|uniref:16S rRNA (uracil(1498)-N(3))-methyltransferase n=1 Tax=Trueperella pecoris TaxID=2733571 RepID=UPI00186BAD59|nr:16S rRNA (uracil(1498)-N(3))-methyltransferase [Trueperella pecoris]QOQ38702.1 16S rRNA (uracil(1498)-N(3))-methyltransferase [Trueperella pecoris]